MKNEFYIVKWLSILIKVDIRNILLGPFQLITLNIINMAVFWTLRDGSVINVVKCIFLDLCMEINLWEICQISDL
jgi:hypothetical protein